MAARGIFMGDGEADRGVMFDVSQSVYVKLEALLADKSLPSAKTCL